jgi:hypothetical protein
MEDEEFEDWKICWEANLAFHTLEDGPQKCIICSQTTTYSNNTFRSTFWQANTCSAGHKQAMLGQAGPGTVLGVCATCDQDFMLNVVKGKHICRMEGCRRPVRVNMAVIKEKLERLRILKWVYIFHVYFMSIGD